MVYPQWNPVPNSPFKFNPAAPSDAHSFPGKLVKMPKNKNSCIDIESEKKNPGTTLSSGSAAESNGFFPKELQHK